MSETIELRVNGQTHRVTADPETPLLYVLRNDLGLKGPKLGCGVEQCGACKVLIDGAAVPSCHLPLKQVTGSEITTVEGLGSGAELHPLQEAFLAEQAAQCGYCTAGMIIAAQGLLNRRRYPTDEEIREALSDNLCRCGVYDRIRRAIKLRIGRPLWEPIYEVRNMPLAQPASSAADLPGSLRQTPDLDSWIRVNTDGTITVFSGKVELGQGIKTALTQIAAEELDVAPARIQVVTADTGQTPDEGTTAGSMSVETSGNALRFAAAEARHILLELAFEQLNAQTPPAQLVVTDGTITDPATGRQTSYQELMGGRRFGTTISGVAQPKHAAAYTVIGQAEPRIDLPGKVAGTPVYIHDLNLPDMLHARVVRPPGYHARLVSVDLAPVRQMPGVIDVVQDGSFLAVIAGREEQAVRAADALRERATWQQQAALPDEASVYDHLRTHPGESSLIVNGVGVDDPIPDIQPPADATQTLTATYLRPYHMHASLGPSAAVAHWVDGQLTVWTHSQGVYSLQAALAPILDIDPAAIRVIHVEGAGCYGHNGADDAALDAALIARAVPGRPVMLKWQRADEHGWEPYGSAMVIDMQASLNAARLVVDWNHDVYSYIHSTRPRGGTEGADLLAAWHLARPFTPNQPRLIKGSEFGSHRNAWPKYAFPRQRVVKHFVPDSPLRVSAMRSLGAFANVFAIESFMDELAQAAGVDPVAFRLRHLTDERARAVIQAAVEKAGWTAQPRPSGSGRGRGIAFSQYKNRQCYAAVVVEVQVDRSTGAIQIERVVIAADAGQVVNPDGLSNQLEGGFVQAASWTLFEQVRFDAQGITSRDWDTYPILRMADAPVIESLILNRPGLPFLGSGEAAQPPTPAAIANAVFDAVGIRLRQIPFTPERVRAALMS
ncbi:MAG TPA: molybdopterin cofactor-binding domain-containing protein [Spirillospora sp.]|nr:molybdopterin cofactor-binding domain-containing protein [Spirillospora sp.]